MSGKNKFRIVLRLLAGIVAGIVILFALFLAVQTIAEYKPDEREYFDAKGEATAIPDTLTITSYNIGYCGLGAEMDFFYEGGTMDRPTREQTGVFKQGVLDRLQQFNSSDFILIQEIDTCSKRSWYVNQMQDLSRALETYVAFFALNYKAWVPLPVAKPMGKVRAGQATFSRYNPSEVVRYAFSEGYSWPMSLFMLKRCYLVTRYKTSGGNELVLVNIHNSAFSDAAEIRKTELAELKQLMESEFAQGNFVIVGGDWNQNPLGFDTTGLLPNYLPKVIVPPIPDDFLPDGWRFAFDPLHSTNRDVDVPYTAGKTKTTLIDFFALSPNVALLNAETTATGFAEADHQPVTVRVALHGNNP
ncbi:MAG TPA: hypothetical protein PLV51_02170 [Lentimicrobium sp.]|nr:hypothetical protein [Lentimicrobium sp.]